MHSSEPPIIDWDEGLRLAGNKEDLATELLALLIRDLPDTIAKIKAAQQKNDYKMIWQQVHKLHGALCYCGLPRIKNITALIETDLKNNIITNLQNLISQLEAEVKLLLLHHAK